MLSRFVTTNQRQDNGCQFPCRKDYSEHSIERLSKNQLKEVAVAMTKRVDEVLLKMEPHDGSINLSETALLIIDMQVKRIVYVIFFE